MDVTGEQIAEWMALCDKATPGPWEIYRYRTGGGRIHISGDDGRKRDLIADMEGDPDQIATVYNEADREFLLAAREGWPTTLAALRDARAEVAELRDSTARLTAATVTNLLAERDEARAEVVRLTGVVQAVETLCDQIDNTVAHHRPDMHQARMVVTARVRAALATGGEETK